MPQARVISVLNQKGGVGKTTITTNLAHGLSINGFNVLAVDLDPQAQLTASLGILKKSNITFEKGLLGNAPLESVILQARKNLKLVPASHDLSDIDKLTHNGAKNGLLLKEKLTAETEKYDFIIIDCPPSSGLLIMNAILSSNEIITPMTGDYLGLQGLAYLMRTLKRFESTLERKLVQWVVLSRFQAKRRLSQEVKSRLKKHFPNKMFKTDISESVVLAECPGFGKTVFEYRPTSKSAEEYRSLVDDLLLERTYHD
ncbi:Chromosome (plasmid) partitioning protein ParA [hydrothermal vent metagenome]|uniref:Chromosome (Plasmid) partitioning protein ParA n=1 Tax=hydrothermal vent metagenome TaxID=652676 RepID=A0A3B1B6R0_9ZZZZ